MAVVALTRSSGGLRDVYGRGMNIQSEAYYLPADSEEHDRLTLQHRMWKLMYGGSGFYPPEVEETMQKLLSQRPGGEDATPPSILDLGSGSGIWAAEMAAFYPHANVVGLDLTEPKLRNLFPPNCSFVMADLTKGLDDYRESFDVVHCRCVAGHILNRAQLMQEIVKVLKPGGLLLIGDANAKLFSPDGSIVVPAASSNTQFLSNKLGSPNAEPGGSWMALWFQEVIGRQLASHNDPDYLGGEHVGNLVRKEPTLEFTGKRTYLSPVRPWKPLRPDDGEDRREECERSEGLARLTGRNMLNFLPASKPFLLSSGIPEEIVNDWFQRARTEVTDPCSNANWAIRWDMAWATKRSD
ncbi:S-adenosyl-L-methionine-dependent methyltransferase [Fomitiporia mediterranea MF3/22]|uniref:S-adenosyl-L-methionine-dependent methyltransferase n=1 Tax=Fomitiporia mediterranea (strain MF3/22) TaxID=694068 RepID=UPI000440849B|nr:S-adenosyl-L-methionine-dependent methyltransferase [Fomitiporia mediterranea MF3/22]EJC99250.1 S-adenosyl-L-methionine-dependent methyltransferase [Fomitiporia mediterranea MF3/22]